MVMPILNCVMDENGDFNEFLFSYPLNSYHDIIIVRSSKY